MEPLIVIMGPTASGKSAMALERAAACGGEIVSIDSMQLYRSIPIGTAQPTEAEQRQVPHHLVGNLELSERVDVYRFVSMAEAAIREITARGRRAVLAGGTGFYLKSLLYGLDDLPGDEALRRDLDARYDRDEAFDELRDEMAKLDPAGLAKWHDCRRKLIRALEVRLVSGRSILTFQQGARTLRYPVEAVYLEWEPAALRQRIAVRTELMLRAGWIEEAEAALAAGILETPTAHQALGYRVIGEYLAGRMSYEQMRERIVIETGQFARRQRTWFRHQHPEAKTLKMG